MKCRLVLVSFVALLSFFATSLSIGEVAAMQPPSVTSPDKIIADCTAAINNNPNDAVMYFKRGNAYIAKYQYDLAIKDLDRAIYINPNYAAAYMSRGIAYGRLDQDDKALIDCNKVIMLDPAYTTAYLIRSTIYIKKYKYDLAIEDSNKAIGFNPKLPKPYFQKAAAYEKSHYTDKAIAVLRILVSNVTDQTAIEKAKLGIQLLSSGQNLLFLNIIDEYYTNITDISDTVTN